MGFGERFNEGMIYRHLLETPHAGQYELPPTSCTKTTSFGSSRNSLFKRLTIQKNSVPGPGAYNPTYIDDNKIRVKSACRSMGKIRMKKPSVSDNLKLRGFPMDMNLRD